MNSIEAITPDWPAPKNVMSYCTTRIGGVSKNQYESLNVGLHVDDIEEHVVENRNRVSDQLQLPSGPLWLNQQHSNCVIQITYSTVINTLSDAAYTTDANLVCVVQTADCLPIFICDKAGTSVAAIHAGWRGLLNGVIENTLKEMSMENSELLCWLGPAIGPEKFEVGEEVQQQFITKNSIHSNAFCPYQTHTSMADIYQIAKNILTNSGVNATDIYGGNCCTHTEFERFFSYRRDGQTGRMASLIWLK